MKENEYKTKKNLDRALEEIQNNLIHIKRKIVLSFFISKEGDYNLKIIKYKKIRNKYRVYFDNDNTIDLYENIILKYNLLLKKEINDKVLKK